jgi:hypothetical protein
MARVNIDPTGGEANGRALKHDGLARNLCLDDRQTLRE